MSLAPLTTEAALDAEVARGDLLLAYFSIPSCKVCKALRPRVEALLERLEVPGVFIDTTALPETAGQRLVFAVPTLIVYGDRRELNRFGRHLALDELEDALTRLRDLLADAG